MDNLLRIFAENLRFYRIKAGISQEALGSICGLHRTYISSIERGKRNISIRNVERIAVALNIEPHELLIKRKKEGQF